MRTGTNTEGKCQLQAPAPLLGWGALEEEEMGPGPGQDLALSQERAQWGGDEPQTDCGAACSSVTTFSLLWHTQRYTMYWLRQQTLSAGIQLLASPFCCVT